MKQKNRDRMIELFVFYDFLTDWLTDEENDLKQKDKNKIDNICKIVVSLMVSYKKDEGMEAVNTLLGEAEKYKFAMINKDEKVEFTDSFELGVLKNAISKVINNSAQCDLCNRKDFKYCEWYTINRFLDKETKKCNKKECPYRQNVCDIFEIN